MTTQDHVLTPDKWGLSAVSPVRRGTASRLGLRTPRRYATGGIVTTPYLDFSGCVLTPKQEQELREQFAERLRNQPLAHRFVFPPEADRRFAEKFVGVLSRRARSLRFPRRITDREAAEFRDVFRRAAAIPPGRMLP